MCANCENHIVQVECEDCNSKFCEECFTAIHAPKFFSSHKRAPIGTILTVGKCKRHKKDLDLICKNCKVVVCHLCSLSTNHNSHSCVPIDEHIEEAKAGISKKIDQVDQDIGLLKQALEKVKSLQSQLEINQKIYEVKVNELVNSYLSQIEERRKSILEKSKCEHQERMSIVQDQYSTMTGFIENMEGIRNAFEKVLHFRNVLLLRIKLKQLCKI